MRKASLAIITFALLGATGCASSLKLENVAGTWSCDRVDGVCADISMIDQATIGSRIDGAPIGAPKSDVYSNQGQVVPISTRTDIVMPSRTADEVARIVLAPTLDVSGRYHSSRIMFAVMKPGDWVPGSLPTPQEAAFAAVSDDVNSVTRLTPETNRTDEVISEQIALETGESVATELAGVSGQKVVRTVRRYSVPTPSLAPESRDQADAQLITQTADETDGQ
ncbi:MAG: TraV family lipoprotein [Pseudomonadota bacterium]